MAGGHASAAAEAFVADIAHANAHLALSAAFWEG